MSMRLIHLHLAALAAVALAATATGDTIHLREGGGTGFTDATFDDTYLAQYPVTDWDTNFGTTDKVLGRPSYAHGLLAIKDLFTLLPKIKDGKTLKIQSATLHVYSMYSVTGYDMLVYRMLTDWLPNAAGANETHATYNQRDVAAGLSWAAGSFGAADYTAENFASQPWNTYGKDIPVDVTALLQDIYAAGVNYGFYTVSSSGTYNINFCSSEKTTPNYRPSLEIGYEYVGSSGTVLFVH